MTQYIYLASPVKLPTGAFGQSPISPDKPNVYRTEYDFTHLYFENNYDSVLKKRVSLCQHTSFEYQVTAYSNAIPKPSSITGSPIERKCLSLLYQYLEVAIRESGIIEYYTCISGQEDRPISDRKSFSWSKMKNPYDLVIEDREFIEITL
jgi:hypothetical protein